jgi:hypothetical protein
MEETVFELPEVNYRSLMNKVLDNLIRHQFTKFQYSVILYVSYLSFGLYKQTATIPHLKDFEQCGVRIQDAKDVVREACENNIIEWDKAGRFAINQNFNEWKAEPVRGWNALEFKSVMDLNLNEPVTKNVSELRKLEMPKIPKPPKPTAKKRVYAADDPYYQMAVYFHGKIMEYATALSKDHLVANANFQTWADDFRKIIEIDKRDKPELKKVIDWCSNDPFWQQNILSPSKLREKYAQLAIKMDVRPLMRSPTNPSKTVKNNDLLNKRRKEMVQNGRSGHIEIIREDNGGISEL